VALHLTPNLEDQVSALMPPSDRVAQVYPQAPGSLSVAFHSWQGYGGGILTYFHKIRLNLGFVKFLRIALYYYLLISLPLRMSKYFSLYFVLKPLQVQAKSNSKLNATYNKK
jgi:hypothetical protein